MERAPGEVLVIGTGKQAHSPRRGAGEPLSGGAHPACSARSPGAPRRFARRTGALSANLAPLRDDDIPDSIDVVITTTTSKTPVYTLAPQPGRLVIGVGAFTPDAAEIAASTVLASDVFVDDPRARATKQAT